MLTRHLLTALALATLPACADQPAERTGEADAAIEVESWATLLDNAVPGVHLVGADGTILYASASELRTMGYDAHPAEYIGHDIRDFHVSPDAIAEMLGILVGGGELRAFPAQLRARDGHVVNALIDSNVHFVDAAFQHTRCFTTEVDWLTYQLRWAAMHQQ